MRLPVTRCLGRPRPRATVLAVAGVAVAVVVSGCGPPRSAAGGAGMPLPAPATDRPADPPTTTTTALPTAAPPTCDPLGFVLTVGPVDGASGLRVMPVQLRNCGVRPLTLHGYPAMRVLDADRLLAPVAVLDGISKVTLIPEYDVPPRTVTLRPGGRAMAVVAWRNTVTDPNVVATRAPYLQVAPAAGQPAQLLVPDGGLDVGNTGRVAVSPWLPDDTPPPSESPTPAPPTTVPPPTTPPATRAFRADVGRWAASAGIVLDQAVARRAMSVPAAALGDALPIRRPGSSRGVRSRRSGPTTGLSVTAGVGGPLPGVVREFRSGTR